MMEIRLKIIQETFSVCKVKDYTGVDLQADFVFTGSTDKEKSLVCPTSRVPDNTIMRNDGWRAFRIEGILDFSLIGILAKISKCLADNSIGIIAISTYNTDYILIKAEDFEKAFNALRAEGYNIEQ